MDHPKPKPGWSRCDIFSPGEFTSVTITPHAGPFGPLRPLWRSPAQARRPSAGRGTHPAARSAGDCRPGGPDGGLANGAPRLADPGADPGWPGLRPDRQGVRPARRRRGPDLPNAAAVLERLL